MAMLTENDIKHELFLRDAIHNVLKDRRIELYYNNFDLTDDPMLWVKKNGDHYSLYFINTPIVPANNEIICSIGTPWSDWDGAGYFDIAAHEDPELAKRFGLKDSNPSFEATETLAGGYHPIG